VNPVLLADIVVVLHLAYAAFVVAGYVVIPLGGWLGWNWVRRPILRIAHLIAIAFVAFESAIGMVCPLTSLESNLRLAAGTGIEEGSFIARLAARILFYHFPEWVFGLAYALLTRTALFLLWLVPPRREKKAPLIIPPDQSSPS